MKTGFIVLLLPAALSCKPAQDAVNVSISHVVSSPTLRESVTLKNSGKAGIDISGWTLGDSNNPTAYHFPEGTVLDAGFSQTFNHSTLHFGINDSHETLYLRDAKGATISTWHN